MAHSLTSKSSADNSGHSGKTLPKLDAATFLIMVAMVRQPSIEKVKGIRISHKKSKMFLVRFNVGISVIYCDLS